MAEFVFIVAKHIFDIVAVLASAHQAILAILACLAVLGEVFLLLAQSLRSLFRQIRVILHGEANLGVWVC